MSQWVNLATTRANPARFSEISQSEIPFISVGRLSVDLDVQMQRNMVTKAGHWEHGTIKFTC